MFTKLQTRILILVVGYAAVWSYSITSSSSRRQPSRRTVAPSHLLFSQQETSEFAINDSELIRSLIRAKTTHEVDRTLRDAFPFPVVGDETMLHHLNETSMRATLNSFPQFSINVTAAALRRMAHVSVLESRDKASSSDPATKELRKKLLVSLLETIGSQIVLAQRSSPVGQQGSLGVYALCDILQGLAILSRNNGQEAMQPLARLVLEMMSRYETTELYKLGPIRLVQCLQASAKLQLPDDALRYRIFQRLLKPDAVSKLPARYLSHGLAAIASLNCREDRDALLLTRAFLRRLRKHAVRDEATIDDLSRALVATNQIIFQDGHNTINNNNNNGSMEVLFQDEAAIFGFTTLRAILQKKHAQQHVFSASELTDMISSWASLTNQNHHHRNNKNPQDSVIEELLQICQDEETLGRCNMRQLEKIVRSVEQLDITNHAETMKQGGERLVTLTEQSSTSFHPRTVNGILRCPVLLHRRDDNVMKPYLDASSLLFVDDAFLEKCSVKEIANFLWFMSMAQWRDEGVLQALGHRILDPALVDSCSPKLASRILGTYTSILSLKNNQQAAPSEDMLNMSMQIFHSYGGHLLTSQLSPAEISSSLYAYAKVSYVHDMGIYDHLVALIASMSSQCTVRQLAQSLWSCGKMIAWEQIEQQQQQQDWTTQQQQQQQQQGPPYFENAKKIAKELSLRADELSPVDVTQCIWALGRLGMSDERIVSAFTDRAKDLVQKLNAVEMSNILWGMAKTRNHDDELIAALTEKMTRESEIVSPREAASALYALGRLRVQDEEVFDKLSQIMIEQINDTSAQAIANALWAYRNVHLRPPRELLNVWATQKLGLVGVQLATDPERMNSFNDK